MKFPFAPFLAVSLSEGNNFLCFTDDSFSGENFLRIGELDLLRKAIFGRVF